jgi:hypothetical protein
VLEGEPAARQHAAEVLHHLACLRFDSFWIRRGVRSARKRHLAGDEDPAIGLDRVAERRDRVRRAADHVKEERTHGEVRSTAGTTSWFLRATYGPQLPPR